MPSARHFLLVLAIAMVASLHGCDAGGEPIADVASAAVAIQPVLPAPELLPGTLEVPATTAEAATATHSKQSWSKSWSKNWSTKRSVTITQFWQNNVWYSAWLSSLKRAVEVATIVPSMSTLLAAVTVAGVAGPLSDHKTEWTILAPTNAGTQGGILTGVGWGGCAGVLRRGS